MPLALASSARAAASSGTLYFSANDGVHGRELWTSDGTESGTVMVRDIRPGPKGSRPTGLAQVAGTLYFSASDGVGGYELWKSDGTDAGTVRVDDIRPGPKGSHPAYLIAMGKVLFFVADDGTHHAGLWKSDGSAVGTVLVKEIQLSNFSPVPFVTFDGGLYFLADDGVHGSELWKSDGTAAGTGMVKDIFRPGRATSNDGRGGQSFAVMGGVLYFTASADHVAYDDWVDELWKSDGTTAGTVKVADLAQYGANTDPFSLFAADDLYLSNSVLLTSDGTTDGTALLAHVRPSGDFAESGGDVYFSATSGFHTSQLWRSDGTEVGTVLVRTFFVPGSHGTPPAHLTDASGRLLFAAADGAHGDELWRSDGTELGTVMVKDIDPGLAPSRPTALLSVPG
jgi:ELWxxDGT repeat protein